MYYFAAVCGRYHILHALLYDQESLGSAWWGRASHFIPFLVPVPLKEAGKVNSGLGGLPTPTRGLAWS